MPDGNGLRDLIVERFLKPAHQTLGLKDAYDLACSTRSTRELQKFIHDNLVDFAPTTAHYIIPTLPWAGIATTNYDLLVERAYEQAGQGDRLVVSSRDGDVALDEISRSKTVYLKLHGCLTEHEDIDAPLITSTEQIIGHSTGRSNLFKTFLEWGQNNPMAIVGYGMSDENMRRVFQRLIDERDGRPRHYIIRPGWDELYEGYWRDRRFEPVDMTLEQFLSGLKSGLPAASLQLATLARETRSTTLTRFISHKSARESSHLIQSLETVFEHVVAEGTSTGDAKAFYSGVNQGWFPIEANLDVRRTPINQALRRWIIPTPRESIPKFDLIKGHAGSGKSVALRRIAWEAAGTYERMVLMLRPGSRIDIEAVEEIVGLTNQPLYLFIDEVGEHVDDIRHLIEKGTVKKWPLVIVGAERVNEWNSVESESDLFADDSITLELLSAPEIDELIRLLEQHGSLGELKSLSHDDRVSRFSDMAGRQLLVALHEATNGASFEDILESEYDGIPSAEAKSLYLDICALHRLGPPVRAGLISRVHGIGFDEFQRRFFKPLEHVVVVSNRRFQGDFVYQARHNYIAEVVFERAARTPAHKQEIILRLIDHLNTEYSYDELVLYELIKARQVADMLPDRVMGITVYESAARSVGRTVGVLHQWALYELRKAGTRDGLDRAERLVKEALEEAPKSSSLRHTLAEISLRRAELARSDLEASVFRNDAARVAKQLVAEGRSSHAHHTLAKVALANLDQALRNEGDNPSALSTQAVNSAVQDAESVIRAGLSRYPTEPYLLMAEAELAGKLRNADRALVSLARAFQSNPKAELVANRLALLHTAKGDLSAALQTLKTSLDLNPGSKLLNFRFARLYAQAHPAAELDDGHTILKYLKRGVNQGASNLDSQFWHARQLSLCGMESAAKEAFEQIRRTKSSLRVREEQAFVRDENGAPRWFNGSITKVESGYGFIQANSPDISVFFRITPEFDASADSLGLKVRFQLTFNERGPIAHAINPAV
ncbi:MAG: SIR2 family protein [Phenylobacterium sp.]|uniref:P-loop NTPase n=1 Tax=Phenylobacterium sp. TaxID=1871053 RepID=UPI0018353FB8|nr:SIR2 family protein [Phenylobacterium sp.]MBA4794398.1 SIR2 family protein [Phenylobacterium sp.]